MAAVEPLEVASTDAEIGGVIVSLPEPDRVEALQRLAALEASFESVSNEMRHDIKDIRADVAKIREAYAGRPTWAVAKLITLLSSGCVGLATALASVLIQNR